MTLHEQCKRAVGTHVYYEGTNGNEYEPESLGKPVKGYGLCTAMHDSHGLCIVILQPDATLLYVDPISINKKYRSIDDD